MPLVPLCLLSSGGPVLLPAQMLGPPGPSTSTRSVPVSTWSAQSIPWVLALPTYTDTGHRQHT